MPDSNCDSDGWDILLGLYSGVRNIVVSFWEAKDSRSRFTPGLIYSPRLSIERYLENQAVPQDIEACFSHCLACTKICDDVELDVEECMDAAQRLTVIWCALKLGMSALESSGIYLDVARYLFTWPNLHSAGFVNLINTRNGRCQAILLYYFAGIIRFRSERLWWMRRRAVYMFDSIFQRLKDRCEECTGMAKILRDEDDP